MYRGARWILHRLYGAVLETARRLVPRGSARIGPPCGMYSEYELVLQGKRPGRVVYPGQESPPHSPQSLREICGFRQTSHQPWPFFWTQNHNARLVGTSLALLNDEKRLCEEAVFYQHCLPTEPSNRYLVLPPAVRLAGNWTSVISRWGYGFHHWWMDALPRLAVLNEFPPDTGILVLPELDAYQVETLKLLGLEDRVRRTAERHLVVENYFFASPTAMTGCRNPYAAEWLRRRFLGCAEREWQTPRRFYIRRIGRHRGLGNEAEVIDFLGRRGWAIVNLESMPVPRQIQLFANAELVCGLHGAAFTNLLWSSPGCRALEICAANYLNGVYEGLAECLGIQHRHILCAADGAFVAHVNMKDFKGLIEAMEADL